MLPKKVQPGLESDDSLTLSTSTLSLYLVCSIHTKNIFAPVLFVFVYTIDCKNLDVATVTSPFGLRTHLLKP